VPVGPYQDMVCYPLQIENKFLLIPATKLDEKANLVVYSGQFLFDANLIEKAMPTIANCQNDRTPLSMPDIRQEMKLRSKLVDTVKNQPDRKRAIAIIQQL
jgi:hypothetical protein